MTGTDPRTILWYTDLWCPICILSNVYFSTAHLSLIILLLQPCASRRQIDIGNKLLFKWHRDVQYKSIRNVLSLDFSIHKSLCTLDGVLTIFAWREIDMSHSTVFSLKTTFVVQFGIDSNFRYTHKMAMVRRHFYFGRHNFSSYSCYLPDPVL